MSNPISFRYPFAVEGKAEPEIVEMLQFHDDKLVSLSNANKSLAAKVAALVPGTSSAATTSNVTNISEEIIVSGSNVGFVNDQTGVTSYQTQQSDSGSLLVLNDASAVAVTLAVLASMPGIQLPWWAAFLNLGAGTVTLTPATGTISYAGNIGAASLAITTGNFAFVYFDGTNFWAIASTSSGVSSLKIKTISYATVAGDEVIQMNAAGATTVTLTNSSALVGQVISVKNVGAGTCTVAASSGNIDSNASIAITQWQAYQFYWDGTLWHQLSQSLSP